MRILKWAGITLTALLGLTLVAAIVLNFVGESRFRKHYDVPDETVQISNDDSTIARGRHLVEAVALCAECHRHNLEGGVVFDAPLIASVDAPNLTSGRGGIGATFKVSDFVKAIRQGVTPEGRGLMIMHSDSYHNFSESDLAAIISYVKSVPPVDNEVPKTRRRPLGRIMVALGMFDSGPSPMVPAEVIDHSAPFPEAPSPGVTADYGRYLVSVAVCHSCHGPDLKGGPPIEEGAPPAPNITVYGAQGGWTREQFLNTIRTGVTPYGKTLDGDVMPWKVFSKMTDDELSAIWMYLASLTAH